MSRPDPLDALLGEVRDLTARYQSGSRESFLAFRDLADRLLRLTVLHESGAARLSAGPRPNTFVLGGWNGPDDPLPLNNGRFLRVTVGLYLEGTEHGPRLKVEQSSYQYQEDREGDRWIFRYDFLRNPPAPHPANHLQVRGGLLEDCLPQGLTLERVHFPTARVSLEGIMRLLVEQFGVPTNAAPEVWRPVLAETERAFYGIAHRSLSGPER
ncbi:MAG: hypothetical protein HYY64_15680 [Candidatus Rokubacteria bacterium]|nr:hypothetical protein [Candidatus Rokubacteria bacterium]